MAIRITPPRDDRIERALANPKGYFTAARKRARAEVTEDIRQEEEQTLNGRKVGGNARRSPE